MNKVIQATYHDGNLILDEKLDAALEGQKLTLILVEEPVASTSTEANLEERKQKFLEKLKTYSIKLPEDYKFNREELYDRKSFH
jgi:predicted DNA-binding antitoxin AbrB/MazE fold protein